MIPVPVMGQSDETCIVYMEADDAFQQAVEQAREYPEFVAAQKQADKARKRAAEAMRKADRANSDLITRRKLLKIAISTNKAEREALEELIAVKHKLLTTLEPASDGRRKARMTAYKGQVSDNPRVMAKLILADVERCHRRFE